MSLCTINSLPYLAVEARPFWGPEHSPCAQGLEGQLLSKNFASVLQQWNAMTQSIADMTASEDVSDYKHVALRTVGSIFVKYTKPAPFHPRKFPLDDDIE